MLDWQGLLKFSLKYSDGTKKSEFKQMSQEDKKFLEEALDNYCNAELHKLQDILKQLREQQNDHEKQKIDLLQDLQQLLDSLDKGGLLYQLNGHIPLLKIIFYSKINSNRNISLQILSSANQNDASVQNQSINTGALELLELIQKQTDIKVKQNMMGTISSIVRGQNLQAKRIFIRINGLEVITKLLQENPSIRLKSKINILLRDLIYYDEFLHQTYNDLSSFSNTAGLKIQSDKHDLKYDVNQEKLKQNFKPENQKYKGCIKKFLESQPKIKEEYLIWLKQEEKLEKQ